MPFKRYVEIGRLAIVTYGPEYGQLVIIVDVVDGNRALVDHPAFPMRRVINLKRLELTDQKVEIPRLAKKKTLKKALEDNDVFAKFADSAWGKKLEARAKKAGMTDFDRWQAQVKRQERAKKVREAFKKLAAQE